MASGYGLTGGTSRCFPFWQELLACYVVNTAGDDPTGAKKCAPALENYYECLHHTKEAQRTMAIQAAYRKKMASTGYEQLDPEAIRKLGLLEKMEASGSKKK